MADGTAPYRTIPEVLTDAARRDRDGIWIRSDEGSVSFGGALVQQGPVYVTDASPTGAVTAYSGSEQAAPASGMP